MKPPVILLVGGFGTRLRAVNPTKPKPMVSISGRPFLHWQIEHYFRMGFRAFWLATGYQAELIEEYPWREYFPDAHFEYFREDAPLGTGGAVQRIYKLQSMVDWSWVINGDTFLPMELPDVSEIKMGGKWDAAYCTLGAGEVFDAHPNLTVESGRVTREGPGGALFDAGAIALARAAFLRFPEVPPFSVHQALYPSMQVGRVGHYPLFGPCYDIGTPARLLRFEEYLASAQQRG